MRTTIKKLLTQIEGVKATKSIQKSAPHKIAVVVHLYYVDTWSTIKNALSNLHEPFDLFVTMPKTKSEFKNTILSDFPGTTVIITPNHGRDVYPFMIMLPALRKLRYVAVLKIHSKKSPHRTDGNIWFSELLQELLPKNKAALNDVIKTLMRKDTGIIGPKGHYTSLEVNFSANGMHMTKLLRKIYNKDLVYKILQSDRSQHGFFAGTMFWVRLDAIQDLGAQSAINFEIERGQIDGTFAHALERVICLVPQINNKKLYAVDENGLSTVLYNSGDIPDWSDVYKGPPRA